ncbi:MAG: hypothetical protein ACRC5T_10400 [Cetobacterium sp.]
MIRIELYTLTQEELITFVKKELKERGVSFKIDSYGNIFSIRHKGKPTFVAHCDTVVGCDTDYKRMLTLVDNKLRRPGFILGADDRAGVNLILNFAEKINFILTLDEETGCVGASHLSYDERFLKEMNKTTFLIELDRRGDSDIIGNKHGYCEKGIVEAIQTVLPFYTESKGVYTDIDAWTHIKQGVNISVGYYNSHSTLEFLDVEAFGKINSKMIELSEICFIPEEETYQKPAIKYVKKKRNLMHNYPCDFCHRYGNDLNSVGPYLICDECYEEEELTLMDKYINKKELF